LRVHLLTDGFGSPNGRAFLFPLVVWRHELREVGIELRLFTQESPALTDADLLLIDSKRHRALWAEHEAALLDRYAAWRERCPLIYYDNSDSAGWLLQQVLPVVDGYFKNQLLRDRSLYRRPLYGRRYHSDYYRRLEGVEDASAERAIPVAEPALLEKLRKGWNSGLADYSVLGPARMALYQRLPLRGLLRFPPPAASASGPRALALSARFGTSYARRSVAWQRMRIRERLGARVSTDKLGRVRYYRELCRSRVVLSPFGLGEITLKDFETFLCGALLLKPDMGHMETWPDFYRDGETCRMHRLDLQNLEALIDDILADEPRRREIAARGQQWYVEHTRSAGAGERFASRLRGLLQPFLRGG